MNRKYSSKRRYKKRSYKRRTYKRRYYKRRYPKPIKKPEIHIVENRTPYVQSGSSLYPVDFTNSVWGNGRFINMTPVSSNSTTGDIDSIHYNVGGKLIEGKKIRLKYLYIKGYIQVNSTQEDDFNCKLMVFRWKRNTSNASLSWNDLINNTNNSNIDLTNPGSWTRLQTLDMLYTQDWKNDIKVNFYKKVKNLYRKYDDANNVIPFKIRVPLYDCVLTCDCYKDANNNFDAHTNPSTNGLYFTMLTDATNGGIYYKWKLYYTDY